MHSQRIISFLPSATEMICALGADDRLVGVTHECDYPPDVRAKPVVVHASLPVETMSSREIDVAISAQLAGGGSVYTVDENLLRDLAPDLIVSQDLCQVCAPSGDEITRALAALPKTPHVLALTPHSLDDVFDNLRELGDVIGCSDQANALIAAGRERIARIRAATADLKRPCVFCMEWTDPIYCSGHWVPEMTEIAGGVDPIGRRGADSVRIAWEDVVAAAPEVLVVSPCGFALDQSLAKAEELFDRAGWEDLPAVRNGRAYAVDANSYFARPGPRLVEGVELLAHLIHPERCEWRGAADAFMP